MSDTHLIASDDSMTSVDIGYTFRPIQTIAVTIAITILTILCEIGVFLTPVLCKDDKCNLGSFSLLTYGHLVLWLLFLLFDCIISFIHKRHRKAGYLLFYRQSRMTRRLPLIIITMGCVILLLTIQLMVDKCNYSKSKDKKCELFKNYHFIQGIFSVEAILILPSLCIYIHYCIQFNRSKLLPDAQEEQLLPSYLQDEAHNQQNIGILDHYSDSILERQCDMIRYLRRHNEKLSKRIIELDTFVRSFRNSPS